MAIVTPQEYKNLMNLPYVESHMSVVITNGTRTITLRDKDFVTDSFNMNWRSSNNQTLSLGTTYAASLNFSAFKSMETEIEGAYLNVMPTITYELPSGNEFSFPLGVFRCDKPTVFPRTTSYECYDYMLALDETVEARFSGTPYNVLAFICRRCDITLGNTAQEISSMINGAQTLYIDPKNVRTYRDAVSYVAIILGGYAQFGRDGKLYIRHFHKTPDMILPRKRRTSSSFAGYKTAFAGVKCRFLADQNFYPYEYVSEGETGVILDLGDIPIIEDTNAVKNRIIANIFSVISDLEYDPCEITMVGDPSIEAGDMIETANREGYAKHVLLTSVSFAWRKECTILSEGTDPKSGKVTTAAKKTQQSIENATSSVTITTATYVNASTIALNDAETREITSLRFVTNKDLTAIFGAEIPVYSDADGYVEISYFDSGIIGDTVKARVHAGYNLITLVNHLHFDASRVVLLQLKASTEGIGSASAPTVTIDQNTIRSYIFAQGIEVEAPWDGIITIAEGIEYVETQFALYGLTDAVFVSTHYPVSSALDEIVAGITSQMQTQALSDTMAVDIKYGDQVLRMGEGHRAGMGRMYVRF